MKAIIFIFLACCVCIFSMCYYAYKMGEVRATKEVVSRAKEIEKECYTNQDIEIIIFGETQGEDL